MLLLDTFGSKPSKSSSQSQSQARRGGSQRAPTTQLQTPAEDSETEDDDDDLLLLNKPPKNGSAKPRSEAQSSAAPDAENAGDDSGRASGRIIGSTRPLEDFEKNIARGDLVTKAVEDLGFVIQDVLTRPFASRRHKEMIECLVTLRDTALQVRQLCLVLMSSTHPHPHASRRTRLMRGTSASPQLSGLAPPLTTVSIVSSATCAPPVSGNLATQPSGSRYKSWVEKEALSAAMKLDSITDSLR